MRHNGKLSEMTAISLNSSHYIIHIRDSIEFCVAKKIFIYLLYSFLERGGGWHMRNNGKLSVMTTISLNSSNNIILIRDSIEFWVAKKVFIYLVYFLLERGGCISDIVENYRKRPLFP